MLLDFVVKINTVTIQKEFNSAAPLEKHPGCALLAYNAVQIVSGLHLLGLTEQ